VRSIETDRILRRVSNVNMATNYTLLVGAFILSATILLVYGFLWLAIAAFVVAGVAGAALLRLMLQMGRADRL